MWSLTVRAGFCTCFVSCFAQTLFCSSMIFPQILTASVLQMPALSDPCLPDTPLSLWPAECGRESSQAPPPQSSGSSGLRLFTPVLPFSHMSRPVPCLRFELPLDIMSILTQRCSLLLSASWHPHLLQVTVGLCLHRHPTPQQLERPHAVSSDPLPLPALPSSSSSSIWGRILAPML